MEENNIIICENCYSENDYTRTTCVKCGSKLYNNNNEKSINTKNETIQNNTINVEKYQDNKSTLINCYYCGNKISENAVNCPKCGGTNKFNNETAPTWVKVICFFIPIIGWWIFAFNISSKSKYAKECLIASILPTIIVAIILLVGIFSMCYMMSDSQTFSSTNSSNELTSSNNGSSSEYCIETGCTNKRASGSSYCYTHKPSSSSTYSYCKKSDCYNKVSYSWRKYCDEHSYLEY